MRTTYDAMMELDRDGLANILTLAYLCGKTGQQDPEFLTSLEDYATMMEVFRMNLDQPYEDGMWTLELQTPVQPGDDLWWICDEPPYIRCNKGDVKAVCAWEGGDIRIINQDDGIEKLHERWTCLSKEEAVEMFKSMVKTGQIDPELHFEGITDLPEDEMMKKLEDIDALVEEILGGEDDE